jgi:hypothetical protein
LVELLLLLITLVELLLLLLTLVELLIYCSLPVFSITAGSSVGSCRLSVKSSRPFLPSGLVGTPVEFSSISSTQQLESLGLYPVSVHQYQFHQ